MGDSSCNPISDKTHIASQLSPGKECLGCQVREHCSDKVKLTKRLNLQLRNRVKKKETSMNLYFNEKFNLTECCFPSDTRVSFNLKTQWYRSI